LIEWPNLHESYRQAQYDTPAFFEISTAQRSYGGPQAIFNKRLAGLGILLGQLCLLSGQICGGELFPQSSDSRNIGFNFCSVFFDFFRRGVKLCVADGQTISRH
jgi:hypothetical protein